MKTRQLVRCVDRTGPNSALFVVPGWDHTSLVFMFLDNFPKEVVKLIQPDFRFFANVNMKASVGYNLQIEFLEEAPKPNDDDGLV